MIMEEAPRLLLKTCDDQEHSESQGFLYTTSFGNSVDC